MVKAKKKKRGGFLGLLQQSISGWKNLAKYAASGKWANDISRAVHRGRAGTMQQTEAQKRNARINACQARNEIELQRMRHVHAQNAAKNKLTKPKAPAKTRVKTPVPGGKSDAQRARELTAKMKRGEKLTKTELEQAQAIFAKYKNALRRPDAVIEMDNATAKYDMDLLRENFASARAATVKKAIAKVPTKVPRKGHQRTGTKNGVRDHQTTVSKKDLQAAQAAEVLNTRNQVDPDWAEVIANRDQIARTKQ